MMSKFAKTILLLTAMIALGYTGKAIFGIWTYMRLSQVVPAHITSWEVREGRGGRFHLYAAYTYAFQGKTLQGATFFHQPAHLNRLAAEQDVESWENLSWSAWVDARSPSRSSLQRLFPWKDSLYALLVLGISIYLVVLIGKRSREDSETAVDNSP